MSLRLAVILPTLNERGNIASLIARLDDALSPVIGSDGWEAIVVDDNSADGTADEARRIALADRRVRVLQRIGRRGLASAAIEGMCASAAPYVAVMDADHQHDPDLLPAMLHAVESGEADIAVGSRFMEGASTDAWQDATRERQSALANRLARRLTGVEMTDPMSGFFLLSSARLREAAPRLSGIGFKILLDILGASSAMRVAEFPLAFAARREGESKLDRAIAFEFAVGLYERTLGRYIPTRFALFGTVGALGVVVHMAVLAALLFAFGQVFVIAQSAAVIVAMSFNFWLNNWLTYRDQRLKGSKALLAGWAGFCVTCGAGALANVAVASLLAERGLYWALSAMAGIIIGSVWNYALSSRFVWGRFR